MEKKNANMGSFAEVILPLPLDQSFTYQGPQTLKAPLGARVLVPFGKRQLVGIMMGFHNSPPAKETKAILEVLDDEPLITPSFLKWLQFAASYYLTPLGEVLATALPAAFFQPISSEKIGLRKIRNLPTLGHWSTPKQIDLTHEQKLAFKSIQTLSLKNQFEVALLHGVTGSGKTEIYLHLIEDLVQREKQVLFLVPEIGLTPQIVARFEHSFGTKLGLFHSQLTENQRLWEWHRAKKGESSVVVGTRSALFMPFSKLGVIILDEEHDPSYKQQEGFKYQARDLALLRAKMTKSLVVLGSATPALESFHNARLGKYHYFHLQKRALKATLPVIQLVDFAAEKRQTRSPLVIGQSLRHAICENLQNKEQTLILLNRRGFARCFFCLTCEKALLCSHCSVSLTYHRNRKKLLCHYCDFSLDLPKICPVCHGSEVTLLGMGTETIEEELKTFFPKARIARLDRDHVQKKGSLLATLKALKEHELDILVGTQMIAKGHDIPQITLVGVLGIDLNLGIPDFRAFERTFQLLMQVAGRAGRGEKPGRVIVQSYSPKNGCIQFACHHDYEGFFNMEMKNREELGYPPAGYLIQFRFQAQKEPVLKEFCRHLKLHLEQKWATPGKIPGGNPTPPTKELQFLGPAQSPLEKIRGQYRWQLLLKGSQRKQLHAAARDLTRWLDQHKPSRLKWSIDVDPVDML